MDGDQEEPVRGDALASDKYLNPRTGMKASLFHKGANRHRVDVGRMIARGNGEVLTRPDWQFSGQSAEAVDTES